MVRENEKSKQSFIWPIAVKIAEHIGETLQDGSNTVADISRWLYKHTEISVNKDGEVQIRYREQF